MPNRFAAALCGIALCGCLAGQTFHPDVPKTWADNYVADFEVPLAQRDRSPRHISEEQYYALKVRPIYRSYPVYAPGREPAGYLESLQQREPEVIFPAVPDASKLRTRQDWIEAGKIVFESDTLFFPATPARLRQKDFSAVPLSRDGALPAFLAFGRYYIRRKGVIEVGLNACAGCHTRVMPDGSFFEGAQGTPALGVNVGTRIERFRNMPPEGLKSAMEQAWANVGAPWITPRDAFATAFTKEQLIRQTQATRPSVFARQGTSETHPVRVPSLIGVADLQYLDATGLVRHRSIGDLMRYAAVNEGLDTMAHYGDFQPSAHATNFSGEEGTRYSDEQLYALALYIYSLRPPANPNPFDARAKRGQQVFETQGCSGCHTPPLYTNNKLTPAPGFAVPDDLRKTDAILDVCVGTDPTLAMQTRRGTGFYKVPSLRGVWYRAAFGHGGQAETLEEWLDPARLNAEYVPKGFHLEPGPIKGHEFGLKLSTRNRSDLIAFLKTL